MTLQADVDYLVNQADSFFMADKSMLVAVSKLTKLVDDLSDVSYLSELSKDSE